MSADRQTGSRLPELVAVMDRLRSPGGCPWDAEQTHASLLRYLLEETYEVVDTVESGDRDALREELGDLLLQVVFHARIAEDDPGAPFGIDDVAEALVAKLVRRHPHVFAGEEAASDLQERWDAIKATEKPRASVLDGIPAALPALARADKVLGRLRRAGLEPQPGPDAGSEAAGELDEDRVGRELLAVARRASAAGIDPEAALRQVLRGLEAQARAAEAGRGTAAGAPRG
ncbi:XTP/dITP diphosphohydrolase [Kineococcus xinjiangensis]|uniref:XTP/dITP diphosphohydrolase n=1 Tax=Kineococcus xinjiangensis TaxID=512762 RepID=A0A2S6ISK5_9ACTN|nr:MazG family protein [Kineococcus xinjiangensis]PPK97232.1 XTP/dITP diphosphohydrolase [Kineococcus xinjiangensis]